MNKLTNIFKKYRYLLLAAFSILFAGCKKEVQPVFPGPDDARINFFDATETFRAISGEYPIFINDSVAKSPFFPSYIDVGQRQYPFGTTNSSSIPDLVIIPEGTLNRYDPVYWFPVAKGDYRFIFASANKTFLKETALVLADHKYTTLYISESPENDNDFRITVVPEELKRSANKVRVRFIHLGADTGPLNIYQTDANGNKVTLDLPQNLSYGSYSGYTEIDTAGSAALDNNVLLKFYTGTDSDKILLTTAIPAIAGSTFIVVVQGFQNPVSRRIKTGADTYQSVDINPNLRVSLRRSY